MSLKQFFTSRKPKAPHAGLFAAILVSHQFAPALTAIKWSLQMLLRGEFGTINAEQKEVLEKAVKKNDMLISLLARILSIAKISEVKDAYVKTPARLEQILHLEIEDITDQAAQKQVAITFIPPSSALPILMLDQEMVRLAIHNILDNAIKYTSSGKRVEVLLKANLDTAELIVKDSGIGIPKANQDKLFTMFTRGNNASNANAKGSGLGLFIAKEIIQAHGGKIWFDSVEGKGTTFHIAIPLDKV